MEEKEFYIRLANRENYSKRELERQISSSTFERFMLGNEKLSPAVRKLEKSITNTLKDTYVLEFLNLPNKHPDFFIDLLFYHRGLQCLVAFELKTDKFRPEYIGQLNFYLEALDRDIRQPNENPRIGVLLCKEKDD